MLSTTDFKPAFAAHKKQSELAAYQAAAERLTIELSPFAESRELDLDGVQAHMEALGAALNRYASWLDARMIERVECEGYKWQKDVAATLAAD